MERQKTQQRITAVIIALTALLTGLSAIGFCLTMSAMVYDLSHASTVLPWLMGCAVSTALSSIMCAAASYKFVSSR